MNTPTPKTKLCNCLKKENCPIRGACLTENVSYYAKISSDNEKYKSKLFKGISKTTFEKCYADHEKSFNAEKSDAKLLTEYWKLANKDSHTRISWSTKDKYK